MRVPLFVLHVVQLVAQSGDHVQRLDTH
jgi:hypothetical protein